MTGAAGLRCPECGHVVWNQTQFFATRRKTTLVVFGIILAAVSAGWLSWSRFGAPLVRWWLTPWELVRTVDRPPWRIDIYRDREAGRPLQLRLFNGGKPYYTVEGWSIGVGAPLLARELWNSQSEHLNSYEPGDGVWTPSRQPPPGWKLVGLNDDINGDTVPDLVLWEYTGGAHCCFRFAIFSLEPGGPRPLAAWDANDSEGYFCDIDGDGIPEYINVDWTFNYWLVSHAESPAPRVILRWNSYRYGLAADLMRREFSAEEIAGMEATILSAADNVSFPTKPPAELWKSMLELIYAGHRAEAIELANRLWPQIVIKRRELDKSPDSFLRDFENQLSLSPYASELRCMNR